MDRDLPISMIGAVRRSPQHVWRLIIAGLIAMLSACASPTPTAPSVAAPTSTAVTSVAIVGLPATLMVGESVQLSAVSTYQNGGYREPLVATWRSSNTSVATVSSTGRLIATGLGETRVTATFENVVASEAIAIIPAPPIARLNMVFDKRGSTAALAGVTEVTFDLSASTGSGLRYELSFGDGTPVTASRTATHRYQIPDVWPMSYAVKATVTDQLGRSDTTTTSVAVMTFAGYSARWASRGDGTSRQSAYMRFSRGVGTSLRGSYSGPLGQTTFTGSITSNHDVTLTLANGITLSGFVSVNNWDHGGSHLILTVDGEPASGTSLDFEFYEPY
jgi:Big-like domain-containing protein/PKD domain-containing protein